MIKINGYKLASKEEVVKALENGEDIFYFLDLEQRFSKGKIETIRAYITGLYLGPKHGYFLKEKS